MARLKKAAFPLLLLAVGGLTFGLLLPRLGFYWDDWAKIAVARLDGLVGYWAYYAEDRPLSAWTHILFTPLLGTAPLGWQILQWLLKLATAWAAWWTGRQVWREAARPLALGALLLLVYPSFTQHAVAVTFFQQWLQFALLLLSLGMTLQATRSRHPWRWTLGALALSAVQLSVTEYFAALELIRLPLLWLIARQDGLRGGSAVRVTLRRFAPYAALIGLYLLWRFWWMKLPGADPHTVQTLKDLLIAPLPTLRSLANVIAADSLHVLISAWSPLLQAEWDPTAAPALWIALAIGAACGLATALYMGVVERGEAGKDWTRQALLIGTLAFVLGIAPAWLTGRQVVFDAHSDRYALAALWGAGLLWAAAVEWLARAGWQRAVLGGLLVMLAATAQFKAGNDYRWQWEAQRRFYWQLTWRAPMLRPGTALFTETEIFPNQGLFSSSAALNLLYPQPPGALPPAQGGQLAYWWYTLSPRYALNDLPDIRTQSFKTQFRTQRFMGSGDQVLVVSDDRSAGSCLWVLDASDTDNPNLSPLAQATGGWTNLNVILPSAPPGWTPPADLFGAEPVHDWCYFYEKAELARQQADWSGVAVLGDAAQEMGYHPQKSSSNAPREWQPFIEGYAHVGRWEDAARLTLQAEASGKQYQKPLESLWLRLQADTPESEARQAALAQVLAVLRR